MRQVNQTKTRRGQGIGCELKGLYLIKGLMGGKTILSREEFISRKQFQLSRHLRGKVSSRKNRKDKLKVHHALMNLSLTRSRSCLRSMTPTERSKRHSARHSAYTEEVDQRQAPWPDVHLHLSRSTSLPTTSHSERSRGSAHSLHPSVSTVLIPLIPTHFHHPSHIPASYLSNPLLLNIL